MRFLLSRLSSLGDVVCTLPAASALKKAFPSCEVSWVVSEKFADVVRCCRAVDEVILFRPGFRRSDWPELSEPFDCALDMQGLLKSALPILMSKSASKLGYHLQREGSSLFSRRVLPDPTSFHVVDQYVDVARAAGGEADGANFALAPQPGAEKSVRELLQKEGLSKFIVLNPGAGWASKRWPEEQCAEFVSLSAKAGMPVVLIGGNSEDDLAIASRISEKCAERPNVWTGKTNLLELIALLNLATAHVGGDTGSTHMAAALGRPCVGLYGITLPRRSCPYGQIDRCLYDPVSLSGIPAAKVFEIAKEVWA